MESKGKLIFQTRPPHIFTVISVLRHCGQYRGRDKKVRENMLASLACFKASVFNVISGHQSEKPGPFSASAKGVGL